MSEGGRKCKWMNDWVNKCMVKGMKNECINLFII